MKERRSIHTEDMLVFFHVIQEKSVSRAAITLNKRQPEVSRRLSRVEEAFHTSLYTSDQRVIEPTIAGQAVFEMARDILESFNKTKKRIHEEKEEMKGVIRISSSSGFGSTWLMPRLKIFSEHYPEISFDFETNDRETFLESSAILGEVDIAIVRKMNSWKTRALYEPLCQYPLHIYASEKYLKENGTPRSIKDLDHHKIIGYKESNDEEFSTTANQLLIVGREGRPRQASIVAGCTMNIIRAALEGFGLGLMPSFFTENYTSLRKIILSDDQRLRPCNNEKYIKYIPETMKSKRNREFVSFLKEEARKSKFPFSPYKETNRGA